LKEIVHYEIFYKYLHALLIAVRSNRRDLYRFIWEEWKKTCFHHVVAFAQRRGV